MEVYVNHISGSLSEQESTSPRKSLVFIICITHERKMINSLILPNGTSTKRIHWVKTSASALLVPEGIILPASSASSLAWFI